MPPRGSAWQSRLDARHGRPGGAAAGPRPLYPAAVNPPSHRRRTGSPARGGQSLRVLAEAASCQARWVTCGERSGETGCRAHRTSVTRTLKLKDPEADRAGSWRSGIVPAASRSISVCSGDRVRAACRKHVVVDSTWSTLQRRRGLLNGIGGAAATQRRSCYAAGALLRSGGAASQRGASFARRFPRSGATVGRLAAFAHEARYARVTAKCAQRRCYAAPGRCYAASSAAAFKRCLYI